MNNINMMEHPLPPQDSDASIRVGKLDTLAGLRTEMARLYRAARKTIGTEVDPQSAAKLAFILNCISRSIEGVALEERIEKLEKDLECRSKK